MVHDWSQTTKHQMHQFKMAIDGALKSKYETRALTCARSSVRLPCYQLEGGPRNLAVEVYKIHYRRAERNSVTAACLLPRPLGAVALYLSAWMDSGWTTPGAVHHGAEGTQLAGLLPTRARDTASPSPTISRDNSLSLGTPGRSGPQTQGSPVSQALRSASFTFKLTIRLAQIKAAFFKDQTEK